MLCGLGEKPVAEQGWFLVFFLVTGPESKKENSWFIVWCLTYQLDQSYSRSGGCFWFFTENHNELKGCPDQPWTAILIALSANSFKSVSGANWSFDEGCRADSEMYSPPSLQASLRAGHLARWENGGESSWWTLGLSVQMDCVTCNFFFSVQSPKSYSTSPMSSSIQKKHMLKDSICWTR